MNFSDLMGKVNSANDVVEDQNGTRILQLWNPVEDRVYADLVQKAQEYQEDKMQVTTVTINYDEGTDMYDTLSEICLYKDSTPKAYTLPVDIFRGMRAQSYRPDLKEKDPDNVWGSPAVQFMGVTLDITQTDFEETDEAVDPRGVLVEFEGNDIKFEAH